MASDRMQVSVAKLSEGVLSVRLRRGGSVRDALLKAGFTEEQLPSRASNLRVNGEQAKLDATLHAGDFITVTAPVEGGNQ